MLLQAGKRLICPGLDPWELRTCPGWLAMPQEGATGLPHPGKPLPLCIPGQLLVTAGPCWSLWPQCMSRTRSPGEKAGFCIDPLWGTHRASRSPLGACFLCCQLGSVGPRRCPSTSCTEKPGAPSWAISRHNIPGGVHPVHRRSALLLRPQCGLQVLTLSPRPSLCHLPPGLLPQEAGPRPCVASRTLFVLHSHSRGWRSKCPLLC